MSKKVGGLGKGLGAFGLGAINKPKTAIAKAKPQQEAKLEGLPVQELDINKITANPGQPRQEFDPEALKTLQESITQYGVLQPILVRKTVKGYELIAGERRFRAATQAGLKTIPALVREYNDAQMSEVALIENIQRENLNAIEEAKAYQHLLADYGLTQELLSHKVGRSRSHIANFLRLLKLSDHVQELLTQGSISMGQARPLLGLEYEELQNQAADYIIANELSARRVEALVKQLQKNPAYLAAEKQEKPAPQLDVFLQEAEDKLKMLLGTPVRIKNKGKKQLLEIDFSSQDELQHLLQLLEQSQNMARPAELTPEEKLSKLRQFSTTGKLTV